MDPKRAPAFEQFDKLRERLSSLDGIPTRLSNADEVDGMIKKLKDKETQPGGIKAIYEALKQGYTPKEILKKKQEFD